VSQQASESKQVIFIVAEIYLQHLNNHLETLSSLQMASVLSTAAKSLSYKLTDTKNMLDQKEAIAEKDSGSALSVNQILLDNIRLKY